MIRTLALCALALSTTSLYAAQDVAGAVVGAVKAVDRAGKVVVVDTKDGAVHTFHFTDEVAVHTGDGTRDISRDTLHGIDKGTVIVVHYTAKGGRETAHEIDRLGDKGLHEIKGTVKGVDHGAHTITIDTGKGTLDTLRLTGDATDDAARATGKGTEKAAKVTAYYTVDAGQKTAHFVERAF
ncbi:hypothetical protein [Terriglobus sp. TAA 43]|uniref:hypothetical protein n=1 Tax=Terriglobus sp. TAA 43 TaxID=278961 RepID=UPI00068E832E|nr:hypothetical protein [Terriglobus sp. TAA 43]